MGKMTKWKWIGLIVGAVILIIIVGSKIFTGIMEPEWAQQREAVKTAYEKTILTKAVKVERFVGDQIYTVIQGEDKIGQPVIVWVSEQEIRTEMGSAGVSAEQASAASIAQFPDAQILRTMPGVMNGQAVWEVFFKRVMETGDEHHFYSYYTFAEGKLIDTWRLNIQ